MTDKMILAAATAATLGFGAAAQAELLQVIPDADTYVTEGINQDANYGTEEIIYLRQLDEPVRNYIGYVRFDLSTLSELGPIDVSDATLTFTKAEGPRNDTIVTGRFATYGLESAAGNTPQAWDETALTFDDAGADKNLSNVVVLDQEAGANVTEVVTNGAELGGTVDLFGPDLVTFIENRINAGDDAGLVTFLVDFPSSGENRGYAFGTKDNPDEALHPELTLQFTVIPEPTSLALLGLGGLGLLRRRRA